jgi:hypothetical protein
MLFSEIYSAYYNTVAAIIACSQKNELDSDSLYGIVKDSAFPESYLTIGSSLETGKWPLIKEDYSTNIKNFPTMPLTLLQKQWLKALIFDKRFKLFVSPQVQSRLEKDLQDIEPLFEQKDFYLYDKYLDADPYDDEVYIKNFHTILDAVHQKKLIQVEYTGRFGQKDIFVCSPSKIEYSEKDDKFRIISKVKNKVTILNVARIISCEIIGEKNDVAISENGLPKKRRARVVLEIYDDRKAMERIMLAFAHFEKSAIQVDENTYRLTINYDSFDETELVIRVLSFGPMVKVLEPENFVSLIKQRIEKQIQLMKTKR